MVNESEGHIYMVVKKPCDECSQELTYLKKDKSYDFSCDHCKCLYRYYPQWKPFAASKEAIEIEGSEVINFNFPTSSNVVYKPNEGGLDGCENWGVDG
jgi:hypothetical protein